MDDISIAETAGNNLVVIIPILLVLIGLLILYYVLIVKAIIQMLQYKVSTVLLTFGFLSLIPFPLILVLGVMILIIWHHHKNDIQSEKL